MATIRSEIRKAEAFKPKIQYYCIATSAKKDGFLEREVLQLSDRRKRDRKFTVEILFWGDIQAVLCESPEALHKHYGGFGLGAPGGAEARLEKDRERFGKLEEALPYDPTVRLLEEHDFRYRYEQYSFLKIRTAFPRIFR